VEIVEDGDILVEKIKEYKKRINDNKIKLNEIKEEKKNVVNNYTKIKKELSKYNIDDIKKAKLQLDHIKDKLSDYKNLYNIEKNKYQDQVIKTKKLQNLEYDPNCKYCMSNIFVLDAIETKKQLSNKENKIKELEANVTYYEDLYKKNKEYGGKYDYVNDLRYKLKEIENDALQIKNAIQKIENNNLENNNKIIKFKNELEKFQKNEGIIKNNKELESKIHTNKQILNKKQVSIEQVENEINRIKVNIVNYNNEIEKINKEIEELKTLEREYKIYGIYNKIMYRDSIPLYIIEQNLPIIEDICNNILTKYFNSKIKFELDKTKIKSYIQYTEDNYWPLNLTSGMEEFVVSVVIRLALIKISNIQKPNFFIVDEGFGSMDSINFNKMRDVFDIIKNRFDFVIIISHLDKARDLVDKFIDINKENGFSYVNYF
jgi:exonuclease SbcC